MVSPGSKIPWTLPTSSLTLPITGAVGASLSRRNVRAAGTALRPAALLTKALTVMSPLSRPLMSAICKPDSAQRPSAPTVASDVTVVPAVSRSVTVTVRPASTAAVVPETTTSPSSSALTTLSPSSTASMATTGSGATVKVRA